MTLEQATQSLQRILSLFSFADKAVGADYCESIREACGWMMAYRFEAVCKAVALEMGSGKRPPPKAYIATYNRLGEEQGWHRADALKPKNVCNRCGGVGFVYSRMRRLKDGVEDNWACPCPACAREHPTAQKQLYADWAHVGSGTVPITSVKVDLESLTPAGAAWLLNQHDALERAKFDDETMRRIVERAGEARDILPANDTPEHRGSVAAPVAGAAGDDPGVGSPEDGGELPPW